MCQYAEVALAGAARVGPPEQGAAEAALVAAERALGLPPLAVHPLVPGTRGPGPEVPRHLVAVRAPDRTGATAPAEHRDHGRADAQAVPREPVVVFRVERGVGQHPVPPHAQEGGREQNRRELRGVVGRAEGDGRPGEEVRVGVAGGRQLGVRPGGVLALRAGDEVPGRVAGVQPGGVDGGGRLLGDQAGVARGRDGAAEEVEEDPPFSSRPSA